MLAAFRRVLFWCHLVAGVTAGVVILIMSVTGVALTYQKEMQLWADTRTYRVEPPPAASRAAVADLVASARAVDPALVPATITWQADPAFPVALTAGQKTIYVNPYTCDVLGEGTGQSMRAFFTSMTSWHRYLAMTGDKRDTGRAFTGASNLVFLFIVLSGMYLWWPKVWNAIQFRNITWFRRGLTAKARDFNWHNTFGFWFALPLVLVVASGIVISYPWASDLVYRSVGEQPPPPAAGRAGGPGARAGGAVTSAAAPARIDVSSAALEPAVGAAREYTASWRSIALRAPASSAAPLVFTIDGGDAGQPHLRGTLTIDPSTGAVQKWEDFSSQTPGRQLRTFLRFAHTGEIGGAIGQTIAGLASLAGAVLVYTGLALSLRRFAAWRVRRTR